MRMRRTGPCGRRLPSRISEVRSAPMSMHPKAHHHYRQSGQSLKLSPGFRSVSTGDAESVGVSTQARDNNASCAGEQTQLMPPQNDCARIER